MGERSSTRTKNGLPQYVGEKEVLAATGMGRATLGRYRHAGTFPQPVKMGTNKWRMDDVLAWMDSRHRSERQKLIESAVTDPAKLPDGDVDAAIAELGSRLAAAQFGRPVTPSEIEGVQVRKTPDEVAADAARMEFSVLAALFVAGSRLDPIRASLVAAGLLAAIRDEIRDLLEAKTGREVVETDEELQALAADILDQAMRGEFVGPGSDGLMPKAQ